MAEIVGGCLCGHVRYSGTAEPMFTGVCHCKDCQKETGTAFNIVVAVPQAALSFQGAPKAYTQKGDSGQDVVRRFCPNCGSTITSEPARLTTSHGSSRRWKFTATVSNPGCHWAAACRASRECRSGPSRARRAGLLRGETASRSFEIAAAH